MLRWIAILLVVGTSAGCAGVDRVDAEDSTVPAMREAADPDAVMREVLEAVTTPTAGPEDDLEQERP